jgi:flavin-dependent dehydrogenase
MSSLIGNRALIVGAGIGGLTAARVLADYFAQVLVFERDALPTEPDARIGIPQGKHVHVLLAGGQRALCELFPDFEQTLIDTGAVPLIVGLDVLIERPNYDPYPQRDLGFISYAQSRPQLELNVRQHVLVHPNIELLPQCRVQTFVANEGGTVVTGLVYRSADGRRETVDADLIIDASGPGGLTLGLLDELYQRAPETTMVGVDIAYATVVFAMPEQVPLDWKGVFTFPSPPVSSQAGLLMPIEGQRWLLSLGGRKHEEPPGDIDGFMDFVGICGRPRFTMRSKMLNGSVRLPVSAFPRVFIAISIV